MSGLNLIPMKLEQVVFLLLSLIAIYAYWKRDLGSGYTLALVAILGFAARFLDCKGQRTVGRTVLVFLLPYGASGTK